MKNHSCPRTIQIQFRDPKNKQERKVFGFTNIYSPNLVEIFINAKKNKNNNVFVNTLFHELVHTVLAFYNHKTIGSKDEHRVCNTIADIVEAVLKYK